MYAHVYSVGDEERSLKDVKTFDPAKFSDKLRCALLCG